MFCRIGDFYELFYEDAIVAARELQLTLTARDKRRSSRCAACRTTRRSSYIQRLLRKGYRIALCEQMEDPKTDQEDRAARGDAGADAGDGDGCGAGRGARACGWRAWLRRAREKMRGWVWRDRSVDGRVSRDGVWRRRAWALAMDELARMRAAETDLCRGAGFGATTQSARESSE
jgi:DNA mismatch repair protein MutS